MKSCSSHLKSSAVFILIFNTFAALSQFDHDLTYLAGCFTNGSTEILAEIDDEQVFYVDFKARELIFTLPPFAVVDPSEILKKIHLYNNALKAKKLCSALMAFFTAEENYPAEKEDPPESVLYTDDEVQQGVENRLICFVNHFYPPLIKISWTKNNQPVTEGVSTSRFYPNKDLTFHQFSALTFTPSKGDIYSCTVEHIALEMPNTRTWEPDFSHETLGVGLDIFCGVGLGFGFLGVAVGTFLIVKGLLKKQFRVH